MKISSLWAIQWACIHQIWSEAKQGVVSTKHEVEWYMYFGNGALQGRMKFWNLWAI